MLGAHLALVDFLSGSWIMMMKFLGIPPFGDNSSCEIKYHNLERMKSGVYPKNKERLNI